MPNCPQERRAAAPAGALPQDFALHLEECATCAEVYAVAANMRRMANELATESGPSAASMWWRLSLRARQERARRAEKPLIWMSRILYAAIAVTAGLELTAIPGLSGRTAAIGFAALGAVALPVAIALLSWSRSKI
jgi:hypothetical protein